ncbi:Glutamine amidotransferase, class I [hydrothermal vent metagenome]|uniref:Glutamine amidotransferase, class I n=1 Tax=hydrothermal vent metagenome TaxID=652676 RepID=A0A3B0SU50_9ZZZZ
MPTAVAIRHISFEGLGIFEEALEETGYTVHYYDIGEHDLRTPELGSADLAIILGGPISANDDTNYPFLKEELKIIERRLADNQPTMGICLGAQLIARAAGARVYPSGHTEIGFAPITLTDAGSVSPLASFADDPVTFHWHGDTFDLPAKACRLASTKLCENQAFTIGRNTVGFQFHPELDARTIEKWLVGHAAELASNAIDIPHLRARANELGEQLATKARKVMMSWLKGING